MKTNINTLTAVNNAEYQQEGVGNKNNTNKYTEEYKNRTLEILENSNTTFSEFIKEQSLATDISRLGGLKQGTMLKEQLKGLGLYDEANKKSEKNIEVDNNIFGAPNKTVKLGGLAI